jgi:16S rRNA (uracil1498-N3)-methyltransferase
MHVFFQPDLTTNSLWLSEEESKHCIRVLRLQQGDIVYLADGKGTEAKATISEANPKKCQFTIVNRISHQHPANYSLHIAIAPTKSADRIEWFIEKATEAGIEEITFIETTNSERAKVNLERCQKVAISAMKQSKQWFLPRINPLVSLEAYLKTLSTASTNTLRYMAWCEQDQQQTLPFLVAQQMPFKQTQVHILIGPEGDFTKTEVQLAQHAQFESVSLGASILRTETAALYACMALKALAAAHQL